MDILKDGFDTKPIVMLPMWQVAFLAPEEDVDRIFDAVAEVAPLDYGKTDRNGYRLPGGIEYYRPKADAPTGADDPRQRPGVDQMRVFIPRDSDLLNKVIEAIYEVHSYYEPPITVTEVLRSQTKGLDDSQNPHRWWNKDGDWKKSLALRLAVRWRPAVVLARPPFSHADRGDGRARCLG